MAVKEIKKIISEFINGAIRAQKAGADGVELHEMCIRDSISSYWYYLLCAIKNNMHS